MSCVYTVSAKHLMYIHHVLDTIYVVDRHVKATNLRQHGCMYVYWPTDWHSTFSSIDTILVLCTLTESTNTVIGLVKEENEQRCS